MSETYALAATPLLFPHGEFEGKLKGVTFTATSPADIKQWFAVNCGQFEQAFARLVPATLAQEMIAELIRGDNLAVPGLYLERQFNSGFIYVHNRKPVVSEASPGYTWLKPVDADGLRVDSAVA